MESVEQLDAFGRLLDQAASYYELFPVVWWTIVGLLALWILRPVLIAFASRGRRGP